MWNLVKTMETLLNISRLNYIKIELLVAEEPMVKLRDFHFLLPSDMMINGNADVYYVLSIISKTNFTIIIKIWRCIIDTTSDMHVKFDLNWDIIMGEPRTQSLVQFLSRFQHTQEGKFMIFELKNYRHKYGCKKQTKNATLMIFTQNTSEYVTI